MPSWMRRPSESCRLIPGPSFQPCCFSVRLACCSRYLLQPTALECFMADRASHALFNFPSQQASSLPGFFGQFAGPYMPGCAWCTGQFIACDSILLAADARQLRLHARKARLAGDSVVAPQAMRDAAAALQRARPSAAVYDRRRKVEWALRLQQRWLRWAAACMSEQTKHTKPFSSAHHNITIHDADVDGGGGGVCSHLAMHTKSSACMRVVTQVAGVSPF